MLMVLMSAQFIKSVLAWIFPAVVTKPVTSVQRMSWVAVLMAAMSPVPTWAMTVAMLALAVSTSVQRMVSVLALMPVTSVQRMVSVLALMASQVTIKVPILVSTVSILPSIVVRLVAASVIAERISAKSVVKTVKVRESSWPVVVSAQTTVNSPVPQPTSKVKL